MPNEKLLSAFDLKLIFERTRHNLTTANDVDFLLSHIASQSAEISGLQSKYRAAMVSARRQAWFVAEWHFDECDDSDLAAHSQQWAGEWTEEIKQMGVGATNG